jgi:hypothetical protein
MGFQRLQDSRSAYQRINGVVLDRLEHELDGYKYSEMP